MLLRRDAASLKRKTSLIDSGADCLARGFPITSDAYEADLGQQRAKQATPGRVAATADDVGKWLKDGQFLVHDEVKDGGLRDRTRRRLDRALEAARDRHALTRATARGVWLDAHAR